MVAKRSPFCRHFIAIFIAMVAPLSAISSGAIFRTKLVIIIFITWWRHSAVPGFKWRHLPDKTGYHHSHGGATAKTGHHHHMVPLSGIQVAPSSGQNWLSSSSHGGATERCQVFKWRHLPDKTGHHHHMVAPLSGARYSSGAIFRTKLVIIIISHGGATERCQFFKWRHLPDKTGYHHHHMVAPLSGARSSSGAIFRTKLVSSSSHGGATERCQFQVAPSSGQNWLSSSSHGGATERCQVFKWRHLPDQNCLSSSSHGGATERCQVFKWRHLPDKTGHHHHHHMVAPLSGARYSSGAIFRTKLVIIIITWWRH